MAGLLAARVLAGHFGQVTVVDRDRLPEHPRFRPGSPVGISMCCWVVASNAWSSCSLASADLVAAAPAVEGSEACG